MRAGLLFLIFILNSNVAKALPPTFGTEFNFGNAALRKAFESRTDKLIPAENAELVYAKKMANYIKQRCKSMCTVEEHIGKFSMTVFKVRFDSGFEFNISVDPACVEIQTQAATSAEIKEQVAMMQKYIFDAAKNCGLDTQIKGSSLEFSAHLNIGARSAFDKQPKDFAHFLADYSNRPALASGVFGHDYYNAPPMQLLQSHQQAEFQKLLGRINANKVYGVDDFALDMNNRIYTESPGWKDHGEAMHYQAAGLKKLIISEFDYDDMPFELRAVRQPRTARDYHLMTELMEKRIKYVSTLREEPVHYRRVRARKETLRFTPEQQAFHFQLFLEEMGEHWEKYQALVPSQVVKKLKDGQITRILSGAIDWSHAQEANLFRKEMAGNFYLSPWLEKRVLDVMTDGGVPEPYLQMILRDLAKQAEGEPIHRAVVENFLKKLKAKNFLSKFPKLSEEFKWADAPLEPVRSRPPGKTTCLKDMLTKLFGF